MLKTSFIHIPGIGFKTERHIWGKGVFSWHEFFKRFNKLGLPNKKRNTIVKYLDSSINHLKTKNIHFFTKTLPKSEFWRLYREFKDRAVFLDIETTGFSPYYNEITLISLFDGKNIKTYITGNNLDAFIKEINKYSLLITYNGALFDLPFIRAKFPSFVSPPHIDLRFFLRRLAFSGGLKAIEEQFGIRRSRDIKDIDGFDATILWNKYTRGNIHALKLLVEYNNTDTINLKTLMEEGYKMMQSRLLYPYKFEELNYSARKYQSKPRVIVKKTTTSRIRLRIGKNKYLLALPKKSKYNINLLLHKLKKLPCIVGIDLSGSEKKASGWALLQGNYAETKLINTNRKIIATTMRAKPKIISIDSPLSIPHKKHGIMRRCERILRARGVYVYPCLLPSMKSLTKRGIMLSTKFKRLGFRVIESYPGAAQDILGIIRKKVDVEELKQGLIDFGIKSDFINIKNNHDKLDAITSALVGYFYLANCYEALGDEKEGYLIVPKQKNL